MVLNTSKMKTILVILILSFYGSYCYTQSDNTKTLHINKPFILGEIDEIYSDILSETRVLNIYLPVGYNKNDTISYPVIYLLDGSADEDFIHISGLVQYNSFEWINRVSKSIVVGIATVDRRRDFTFKTSIKKDAESYPNSGQSDKFITFLEKELKPYIEKKYAAKKRGTIIGQSLGGLLATEILLKKPALFNSYIIISPSLWWDNGSLLQLDSDILQKGFETPINIYIGVGKEGLAPTVNPRVMEVDANVLADQLKSTQSKHVQVIFDYLPDENHATIMHQAVSNAFKVLYSK